MAEFLPPLILACLLLVPGRAAENGDDISRLMQNLRTESESQAYYTAITLARYRSEAVPFLEMGLKSPDTKTRKWSARALTNMAWGRGPDLDRHDAQRAGTALLAALNRESDTGAAWYMVQAIGTILPDSANAIPILLKVLTHEDLRLQVEVLEALAKYESRAASAKPALIELLWKSENEDVQWLVIHAISAIGIGHTEASVLSTLAVPPTPCGEAAMVTLLLEYPASALSYLQAHPQALREMDGGPSLDALLRVIDDTSSTTDELRNYLRSREDLPSVAMAHWGLQEFLPPIRVRIAAADPHRRSFLEACARALGEEPQRVVKISEEDPGSFKPKSAHPNVDPSRMSQHRIPACFDHADGTTDVLITGHLLMSDGSPAVEPCFYRLNDSMLLGEDRKTPVPLMKYNPKTGRFVFLTSVFAAYAIGDGQEQPGPYQTGPAEVLIEAVNAIPLKVRLFDEMPEVEITLKSAKPSGR